jgi:acyl-CoA thioesterase
VHPFDDALVLTADAPGRYRGRTSPAYANMVGPFGGVTAATLLQAVLSHPDRLGDPVALSANYAGPVADGEFEVTATAARTNRSTQHWTMQLTQDGAVATTATAVLAVRRDGWADTELARPDVPDPDSLPSMPDALPLAWLHRYDMRFVSGPIPDPEPPAPAEDSTTTLWVRDRPARPLDFASLAAMCDVFYPRSFRRLGTWMPAGTVTYTVYFHAVPADLEGVGEGSLLAQARGQRFGSGYFDQTAALWGTDGLLLATSHQLVYFKAPEPAAPEHGSGAASR